MNWTEIIVPIVITVTIGIIGYFLKRTIDRQDGFVNKDDFNQLSKDVEENKKDIEIIKSNYLTKEDFFREQAKTDRKLDRIMDILLEMKGGN